MPITIAGSGTITGISAGGLPDGVITTDDIAASAITRAKMGYAGAILQVVQTIKTDTFSTSSTSLTDLTGLSVSITPSSASNKILVKVSLGLVAGNLDNITVGFLVLRGSTGIFAGDAAGSRPQLSFRTSAITGDNHGLGGVGFMGLDSPATTSLVTYKVQLMVQSGYSAYINRTASDANTSESYGGRTACSIIAMEVAG